MKTRTAKLSLSNDTTGTTQSLNPDTLITAAAHIVGAYIINRPNEAFNLTALTAEIFATLRHLAATESTASRAEHTRDSTHRTPVVAVEESVKADYLVCLEDGKRVKMLKRHLKTAYGMSPEQYRARWDLPATYPMVAPNYAKVRSQLAKQIGLGRRPTHHLPTAQQRMHAAAMSVR